MPETSSTATHRVVGRAVRQAAHFDRRAVDLPAGLLAAIPVAAVLGISIAAGATVTGVTLCAGAMLVGIAWRATGGRPPLAVMATDAVIMALATFLGCVTGSVLWLHVIVLAVWALGAGLLVSFGNRGGAVGTQAIIAAVVFGRFSEPAAQAAGLAGYVLAGGAAQVAFLSVVKWPPPLRRQRAAVADAYTALKGLARGPEAPSGLAAGDALDAAQSNLASPTLLGDSALLTLRSLVDEGYRLRVQLQAISGMAVRRGPTAPAADELTGLLRHVERALQLAAATIENEPEAAAQLDGEVDLITSGAAAIDDQLGGDALLSRRLSALAGQLRAVRSLAPAAGVGGGLRSRRPRARAGRPLRRLSGDLARMRAELSLHTPAGRHAIRLAVIVPATVLLARALPLQRDYWMVVAAAAALRPEFGSTFTRGTERVLGTCAGVALAGAIGAGLHPTGEATVALIAVLAWLGYATFPASFAAGFGFITALVVFLISFIEPETTAVAADRLVNSLIGGAIGLAVYLVWPTWASGSAQEALRRLIGAERTYLDDVLGAYVDGTSLEDSEIRLASRRLRVARSNAETAVGTSLAEPRAHRIDSRVSRGELAAVRRLTHSAHVLRLDAQDSGARQPIPALAPLRERLGQALAAAQHGSAFAAPDLRAAHARLPDQLDQTLRDELDEIVDAANTLAELAGVPPTGDSALGEERLQGVDGQP